MSRFHHETIHIANLRVECIIGVRPHEREQPQPLLISLSFPWDFGPAAADDALEGTVDYSAVARAARDFATEGRFGLLETLARRLADHLGSRFRLQRLELSIRKPQAVGESDGPSVSLTWTAEGAAP